MHKSSFYFVIIYYESIVFILQHTEIKFKFRN